MASAPAAKKRRTSTAKGRKASGSTSAATVLETIHPGGWYMPHESQAKFPAGGVDAGGGLIGLPLAFELLCPGGNHEIAMNNIVGSRENKCLMNLFVWLVECAHAVNLTCYVETVVDSVTLHSLDWPLVLRCRLFVPVPTEYVEPLLDQMRKALNATAAVGDAVEGEGSSVTVQPGRASPTTMAPQSRGGWTAASRFPAAADNIDSIPAFMAALSVAVGRPKETVSAKSPVDFTVPAGLHGAPANTSDLLFGDDADDADHSAAINAALSAMVPEDADDDDIDPALCTDVTAFSSRSPMLLLRAEHMFTDELILWDRCHGADEQQLRFRNYYRDGRLMFPLMAREPSGTLPPLVTALTPKLDERVGSADEIPDFMWPLAQASVALLIKQCRATMQYACTSVPRDLEVAQTVTDVRLALQNMADDHPRNIMVRPELIMAPNFPHRSEAPASFQHPFEKIWPIQAASMQWTNALLKRAARSLRDGDIEAAKVKQIYERQLRTGLSMMVTPTRGVDPTFYRLAKDLAELTEFVEKGTNTAAEVARAFFQNMSMLSPKTAAFPDQRPMPLLSAILAQKTALVRGYMNVSAAQVEAFIPIEASGHGMGGDDFGQLQQTWLLKGPFDVGKSYVLDVLGTCVPPSMWHQHHHATAGSKTLPEFRGYHMADEQKTNTSAAGKGRGAASTNSDCDRLSMMGSGWYGVKRLVFDPRRDTDVSRLDEAALDKRQICVAAGNGMYDLPFESRCTVKLMGRNEKTSIGHPDRRELTLSGGRDSPGRDATASFLRYCMALSNRMWVPYAAGCVRRFDTTMTEIFYALTVKYLIPAGFPNMECRQLAMMKRQSRSYAVMRISTQWERAGKLPLEQRDAGRDMYFLANAVVHAQDVLQAYFDITSLTDTRQEEAEILSTLKSRIVYESGYGNTPKEAPSNAAHYVTNIRGPEGLAEACPKLGESIIQSVLPKLQFSTSSGAAKIGFERDSTYRNCLTISKAAVDDPSCLTRVQENILKFLIEVIEKPVGSGARLWYPEVKANGEETGGIVFRSSVLHQIRGGALQGGTGQMRPSKHLKSIPQDTRRQALDMFERANLMSFSSDNGAGDDRSATVANPIASMPGVTRRATRRGLLDNITALESSAAYQAFIAATPDKDPAPELVSVWLEDAPAAKSRTAKRVPEERPCVTVLEMHGVLVVRPTLRPITRAIQAVKCRSCNIKAPPGAEQHVVMEQALQTLIDVLFSISGEVEPGSDIYCGASVSVAEGIRWRRVQPFDGEITITNPRRREVLNASLMVGSETLEAESYRDDMSSTILPPNKKVVTFKCGDNLTARLLKETRRFNVPFADPDDDWLTQDTTDAAPEPAMPQHATEAFGHVGAQETRITASGGVAFRSTETYNEGDEDEFNFD